MLELLYRKVKLDQKIKNSKFKFTIKIDPIVTPIFSPYLAPAPNVIKLITSVIYEFS
jgi:hypothetical protein